jgi:MoxR-like ATPase
MIKIGLELPSREALSAILRATTGAGRGASEPVMTSAELLRIQELVRLVPVDDALVDRVARTVRATHPQCEEAPESVRSLVRHGASPRGAQALLIAAKARALLAGRLAPDPEDLAALVGPTLGHRVVLGYEAEARGMSAAEVVRQALDATA